MTVTYSWIRCSKTDSGIGNFPQKPRPFLTLPLNRQGFFMFRTNGMPRAQDAQERRLSVSHGTKKCASLKPTKNGMPRAQDAQERRRDGDLVPGLAVNTSMWARTRLPVAYGPGTKPPPCHWKHLCKANSWSPRVLIFQCRGVGNLLPTLRFTSTPPTKSSPDPPVPDKEHQSQQYQKLRKTPEHFLPHRLHDIVLVSAGQF